MPTKQPAPAKPDSTEIAETELEKVTGGDGAKTTTTTQSTNTTKSIGSQSTGAGAGKVTFNPF
ncbi:MAG TPA: hypothetical protein VHA35_02335 [Dongiaceae bacterium]|nr:hypothetical protein [Dongiaceae bacterium]